MSKGDRATVKQHYIPQFLLREFAYKGDADKKFLLYRYDVDNKCSNSVPVASVCYKKKLYEYSADRVNILEKEFGIFESKFGRVLEKIKNRELLNSLDITYCVNFLILQLVRTPDSILFAQKFFKDTFEKYFDANEFNAEENRDEVLQAMLDINNGCPLFNIIYTKLSSLNVVIWCTKNQFIINDFRPVCADYSIYNFYTKYTLFLLPITSNRCLVLTPFKVGKQYLNIPTNLVDFVNIHEYFNKKGCVYSKEKLSSAYIDKLENMCSFYRRPLT